MYSFLGLAVFNPSSFSLSALCIWWGECEVFYKKLGEEVSMSCGVDSNSDIEWKFNGVLILSIRGQSGNKRKGISSSPFNAKIIRM